MDWLQQQPTNERGHKLLLHDLALFFTFHSWEKIFYPFLVSPKSIRYESLFHKAVLPQKSAFSIPT